MVRLTRHTWLSFGSLITTLLISLGPAITVPDNASAGTPAGVTASGLRPTRHSTLPPARFVPAPLRSPGHEPVVRFHGRPITLPAHARLTATLCHILYPTERPQRVLPSPNIPNAPHHAGVNTGRHPGLAAPRRTRTLDAACPTVMRLLFYSPTSSPSGLAENTPCIQITVWNATTWASKATADFAAFDAIVFGDQPKCFSGPEIWNTAVANRDVWSAAARGNVIILGTDPDYHTKPALVQQGVEFAASGNATGLYVALSCAYHYSGPQPTTVDLLGGLGQFVTRSVGSSYCPMAVHKIADHAIGQVGLHRQPPDGLCLGGPGREHQSQPPNSHLLSYGQALRDGLASLS
jgi:hypothetical protein